MAWFGAWNLKILQGSTVGGFSFQGWMGELSLLSLSPKAHRICSKETSSQSRWLSSRHFQTLYAWLAQPAGMKRTSGLGCSWLNADTHGGNTHRILNHNIANRCQLYPKVHSGWCNPDLPGLRKDWRWAKQNRRSSWAKCLNAGFACGHPSKKVAKHGSSSWAVAIHFMKLAYWKCRTEVGLDHIFLCGMTWHEHVFLASRVLNWINGFRMIHLANAWTQSWHPIICSSPKIQFLPTKKNNTNHGHISPITWPVQCSCNFRWPDRVKAFQPVGGECIIYMPCLFRWWSLVSFRPLQGGGRGIPPCPSLHRTWKSRTVRGDTALLGISSWRIGVGKFS